MQRDPTQNFIFGRCLQNVYICKEKKRGVSVSQSRSLRALDFMLIETFSPEKILIPAITLREMWSAQDGDLCVA